MSKVRRNQFSHVFAALSLGTVIAAASPQEATAQQNNFNFSGNTPTGSNLNTMPPPFFTPDVNVTDMFRRATVLPPTPEATIENETTDAPTPLTGPRPYRTGRWYDHLNADQSYALAERIIGIPADLLARIAYNESKGDPNAVNPTSGACGLGQLMPNTTYPEMVFKYSETFGFNLASLVEIYAGQRQRGQQFTGYRAIDGQRDTLLRECHKEWVNVSLYSMNIIEKMRRIENDLASRGKSITDFNQADMYINHFLGARADLMLAYREQPNALARNFVSRQTIIQNRHMFFTPTNRPRTVANMYDYIGQQGNGPDKHKLVPRFWDIDPVTIAARVDTEFNVPQIIEAHAVNNPANETASVEVARSTAQNYAIN